jgi:CRP/FNR family transcriptional regulator
LGVRAEIREASMPVFRHACGICALQDWCWPPKVEEEDLCRLHAIVQKTGLLAAGVHLFRTGDPFTAIYAVRSGCIKSYTIDLQGREQVRDFHLPGELLGFDAAYPERHHFNALILEDAALCVIPYQDIAVLSRQIPALQTHILALMSRDFARQQRCFDGADATQQVAIFLFDIETRLRRQSAKDYEFILPMSHECIANYLRLAPETLSRVFSMLQQAGIIRAKRARICLQDVRRLGQIAQGWPLRKRIDSELTDVIDAPKVEST